VAKLIHDLLTNLGKEHPQALVYPLSVASKSQSATRQAAANVILDKMRKHSESLVEAALLVSKELIRVAILWHEMWHEGLEEVMNDQPLPIMRNLNIDISSRNRLLVSISETGMLKGCSRSLSPCMPCLLKAPRPSVRFRSSKLMVVTYKKLLNGAR